MCISVSVYADESVYLFVSVCVSVNVCVCVGGRGFERVWVGAGNFLAGGRIGCYKSIFAILFENRNKSHLSGNGNRAQRQRENESVTEL